MGFFLNENKATGAKGIYTELKGTRLVFSYLDRTVGHYIELLRERLAVVHGSNVVML